MTHDITHCNASLCANKDDCFRYQAHLEAVRLNYPMIWYFDKPKALECYKQSNEKED